ncbi:MAG: GumC family protein, partial [Paracoccus sp. (in: a-proteobacteria)]
ESQAQLMVKLGRENTQVPVTVEKGDVYSTGVQKEEIHSYMRLLLSNEIIDETIDTIGLQRFEYQPEQATSLVHAIKLKVKATVRVLRRNVQDLLIRVGLKNRLTEREKIFKLLKRNLSVNREKDSNVITVSIRLADPQLAQDVLTAIIEAYQGQHIRLNQRYYMLNVFDEQTRNYKRELEDKEAEIESIKTTWKLTAPDMQIQGLIGNIQTFRMTRDTYLVEKQKLLSQQGLLLAQFNQTPPTRIQAEEITQSESTRLIQEELADLKIQRAKQIKLYKEDSPVVRILNNRIQNLEGLLKQEGTNTTSGTIYQPNPAYERIQQQISQTEVELEGLDASLDEIERTISKLESRLSGLRKGTNLLNMLQREQAVLEEKFIANAKRFERIRIDHALDTNEVSNISLMSTPNYPVEPAAPKKLLLMLIGCIFGLFLSTGLAFLREWLLQIIHDSEDVKSMKDIDVLGQYSLSQR